MRVDWDVGITAGDGLVLRADVFRPDAEGRIVSSALCSIATNMPGLIVFRGLKGIGAGALWPLTLATIAEKAPLRERGKYNALLGTGFVAGAIAGPIVGGVIADTTSWRWVFFVNVPVGALALVLASATMPASRPRLISSARTRVRRTSGGSRACT